MNIVVYCGCSEDVDQCYKDDATALGEWIGDNGHTLVWGGCKSGLMGAVARAAQAHGAQLVGVLPNIERIKSLAYEQLDKRIDTETLAERKDTMLELGDAFVALAGGPGTLDEASDVVSLTKTGVIDAPCIFFDSHGYYVKLQEFFENMTQLGFCPERVMERVHFAHSIEDATAALQKELS